MAFTRYVSPSDPMIEVRKDTLKALHSVLGLASSVDALCNLDLHPDLINQFVDAVAKEVGEHHGN